METLYSAWLNLGGSSLTSLMVMVSPAVELVLASRPEELSRNLHFHLRIIILSGLKD